MFFRTSRTSGASVPGLARVESSGALVRPPVLVMQTGSNPVSGTDPSPGWVSGTPANLAAGATVAVLFDLGAEWDQYATLQLIIRPSGPSTGFAGINTSGRDDPVVAQNNLRFLRDISVTSTSIMYSSVTTASAAGAALLKPAGRYVVVQVTNADAANAVGSQAFLTLVAYPS